MPGTRNFEGSLFELQQRTALKKRLEAKLRDLRDQRRVFENKVIDLRIDHRSEQEDVEKLEGRSLANCFYQLFAHPLYSSFFHIDLPFIYSFVIIEVNLCILCQIYDWKI